MTITPLSPSTNGTGSDLRKEYVAGSAWAAYRGAVQALPHAIDDLEHDLGDDAYTRMLRDPQVVSCVNVLKAAILDDGVRLVAAEGDEEVAPFCTRVLGNLATPLTAVLWDLLDALPYGNRVAELVYADGAGQDAGKLVLAALKPKPRKSIAFVVDAYLNVLGLLGATPQRPVAQTGTIAPGTLEVLPRSKFAILTWRPHNGDPRGTSVLRPAYNPWWLKTQGWPEYLKYLVQFGTPSLVGKTKSGTDLVTGKTRQELLLEKMLLFQNGTALALDSEDEVDTITGATSSQNDVFPTAIDLFDRQITRAILFQTRATMEAEHGSRADSGTAKDVFDTIVAQAKEAVAEMLRRDVLTPLIAANFGPAGLDALPAVTLGEAEAEDVTGLMSAVANLKRAGYFAPSQLPAVDTMLNLPARTPEEQQAAQRAAAPPVVPQPQPSDGDEDEGEEGTP